MIQTTFQVEFTLKRGTHPRISILFQVFFFNRKEANFALTHNREIEQLLHFQFIKATFYARNINH